MKRAEKPAILRVVRKVNSSLLSFQLRVQGLNSFPLSRKFTKLSVKFYLQGRYDTACALRDEDAQKEDSKWQTAKPAIMISHGM